MSRPGNNTSEDAGPPKRRLRFDLDPSPPDKSKAMVRSNRGTKRDMTGPKPNNLFNDDDGADVPLRTHRNSSPTERHSPPIKTHYYPSFYAEADDRCHHQERGSSRGSSQDREESCDTRTVPMSIDPSKVEDVTLHLSLPTAYDIEDALEEAARLRKIGHFQAAVEIYEQDLGQFLDTKYVKVQYAECLLEAGQISKFSGLCMKLPDSQLMDSLDLNWAFMKLGHDIQESFTLDLDDVLDNALEIINRNWPRLDSTEVQLWKYSMDYLDSEADWHDLYLHFRDEHMIWEFHDIFVSMTSNFPPQACWRWTFPSAKNFASCLEQLDQDWLGDGTDTSANLALLDILTVFGLCYLRFRDRHAEAQECLDKAGEFAALLRSQDASNIKSRPYLRWMVAKSMIEECPFRPWNLVEDDRGHLTCQMRGFLSPPGCFPHQHWPLYAPSDIKEQIRFVTATHAAINKKLVTIAKAAEEIGDFMLRTACLKELVLNRAEGTEGIMETLEYLWKESGDADSISEMHLYQYLLIKEPSDNDKVRRRILLDGETTTGSVYYIRCRVMAALATSERERNHYQQEAEDYWSQNYSTAASSNQTRERSVSRDRSHSHTRGYDSQEPHRFSGGREREGSPNFPRPSDDYKRNGKSKEASAQKLRPLTPEGLALKEQEQNKIIRGREKEFIGKQEDNAIDEANGSSAKVTDFAGAKYSSKTPLTVVHEDEEEEDEDDEDDEEK